LGKNRAVETIAAPPVVDQPQPVELELEPADDATTMERRELVARELREAILRKLRPDEGRD
jgi:hypothetical protein